MFHDIPQQSIGPFLVLLQPQGAMYFLQNSSLRQNKHLGQQLVFLKRISGLPSGDFCQAYLTVCPAETAKRNGEKVYPNLTGIVSFRQAAEPGEKFFPSSQSDRKSVV